MTDSQIDALLTDGISAAKAVWQMGDDRAAQREFKNRAQNLLQQAIALDETNAKAWLWLSTVVDSPQDRLICLENVLSLDPANAAAHKGVALLKQQYPELFDDSAAEESDLEDDYVHPPQPDCPFCNKPISQMDTVCPHCKSPLVMDCPACNTRVDVEQDTCPRCGHLMGDYRLPSVYFTQLAIDYREHHRASRALDALRVTERFQPDQPDLYRQLGEVLAELGEPGAAISTLETAVKKEPDQIGPYLALGRVLQQEGQWERAEKVYREAMRTAPESSETYYALGNLLLQQNRLSEARKHLQHTVKIDPQHGMAWARLGQLYDQSKKYQPAVRAYRQATKYLIPNTPDERRVRERLNILDPQLYGRTARNWTQLILQTGVPAAVIFIAALLDSRFQITRIHWSGWLAILLGIAGSFLWVTAFSLPRNPVICALTGNPQGIDEMEHRWIVSTLGAILWLAALVIILLPLG